METEKIETTYEEPETKTRRERLMLYAPLLIWIGVIFFLSSGQGSMSQTSRIIRPLLEFLFPTAPEETLLLYHGLIRKLAHFTEYFVLGLLAFRALANSIRLFTGTRRGVLSFGLVLLIALLDELNQSFNPARTGAITDVMIDLTGGLAAILICLWLRRKV